MSKCELVKWSVRALATALLCSVASAQWISVKIPGTPRLKDGKADLSAPAPRTADGKPDLSGIWEFFLWSRDNFRATVASPSPEAAANAPRAGAAAGAPQSGGGGGFGRVLKKGDRVVLQPEAEAIYKEHLAKNGAGLPSQYCLPHGPPAGLMIPIPFKILQTPTELAILFEEFNYFRQIHTDGRDHPVDPTPSWYGYSVGKWDKDTLVVDTVGYNDISWLDAAAYPHSDALHTIERITRKDFGHMEIDMTIDDPKSYKQPFTLEMQFELQPDTELIEHVCDNERDVRHMVGK
jgi:hypothetical protein